MENLEAAIDRLQDQIDELSVLELSSALHILISSHSRAAKISAALKQKRKETALSHLRAKKQYEELQKKRLNSLDTLQSTLIRVETAAGDIEVSFSLILLTMHSLIPLCSVR